MLLKDQKRFPVQNVKPAVSQWITGGLLTSAFIFAPAAFGAATAWGRLVLIGILGLATVALLVGLLRGDVDPVQSWTYLPIALFVLLVIFQQIGIPASLMQLVSPQTVAIKQNLLSRVGQANALDSNAISFYTLGSQRDLRVILCAAVTFVIVLHLCRDSKQIERLLIVVSLIGLGCAVLTISQAAFDMNTIYGVVPAGHKASGPFTNHSHFAQFMNLSIGAALGLFLSRIPVFGDRNNVNFASIRYAIGEAPRALIFLCGATIILGTLAVFLSLSRVGIISLVAAGGFTATLLVWCHGGHGRASALLIFVLVCFAGLLVAGIDPIFERLGTLRNIDAEDGGRWQTIKDVAVAWRQFPLFGTGLGTFQYVYPMYDHTNVPRIATHAENEYAQLMTETGLVGVTLFLVFIGMVVAKFIRVVRSQRSSLQASAFGICFGMIAVFIHSNTDFGQHVPANAILAASLLAVLVNLVDLPGRVVHEVAVTPLIHSRFRPFSSIISIILLAIGLGWSLLGEVRSARAEAAFARASGLATELKKVEWQADNDTYVTLLSDAAAASEFEPRDVEYRYWLNVYRWQSISRMKDRATGQILLNEVGIANTKRIIGEFDKTIALCPTFGPTYWMDGRLRQNILGDSDGEKLIDLAYDLARQDANIALDAASLDFQAGNLDAGMTKLRHSIELRPNWASRAALVCLAQSDNAELAASLVHGDVQGLLDLASELGVRAKNIAIAQRCQREARELLEAKAAEKSISADALVQLADLDLRDGRIDSGIAMYRRALQLNYVQLDWRMRLARALAKHGLQAEAEQEARICLRLSPQMSDASKFIDELVSSNELKRSR
ncbi:MAG TPA: O-antigen ligase family protein [Tepidisphaeraceae bacterium]|nr:O-antigen ligase family protein [Tepidisphaeraceae bacterium]